MQQSVCVPAVAVCSPAYFGKSLLAQASGSAGRKEGGCSWLPLSLPLKELLQLHIFAIILHHVVLRYANRVIKMKDES